MNDITYKYTNYKSKEFEQVINLRFNVLFAPYNKVEKYDYDELDYISLHLVALDKDKVVAYSRITNDNGVGKITNVVVDSEYSQRGIGFEMMKRHIIKAKECNMNYLHLNSRLDTVNFYKRVGFQCKDDTFVSEKSGLILQDMYFTIS